MLLAMLYDVVVARYAGYVVLTALTSGTEPGWSGDLGLFGVVTGVLPTNGEWRVESGVPIESFLAKFNLNCSGSNSGLSSQNDGLV